MFSSSLENVFPLMRKVFRRLCQRVFYPRLSLPIMLPFHYVWILFIIKLNFLHHLPIVWNYHDSNHHFTALLHKCLFCNTKILWDICKTFSVRFQEFYSSSTFYKMVSKYFEGIFYQRKKWNLIKTNSYSSFIYKWWIMYQLIKTMWFKIVNLGCCLS